MQPSTVVKSSGQAPVEKDSIDRGQTKAILWSVLPSAAAFLVALTLALWQHFGGFEPHSVFFSDSRHYLDSCQQLVSLIQSITDGLKTGSGLHPQLTDSLAENMMLDGPLMPLLPALYFALIGKSPTPLDWQPFVMLSCIVHAISAALVCSLAKQLTGSPKWALLAGIGWASYPSALIATGRYLTEVPATLLLLLTVSAAAGLVGRSARSALSGAGNSLLLGVLNGAILLFKPVLVPCSLATTAFVLFFEKGWKTKALMLVSLSFGLAILLMPWALSSKALTGKIHLTPQRVPVFNAAKGCDIEADGWGSLPNFPLTNLLCTTDGVLPAVTAILQTHPTELAGLTMRKVSRLWGVPWNDFRLFVFQLSPAAQKWWHLTLLAASAAGALCVLTGAQERIIGEAGSRKALFVGGASILVVLAHLVYVPFETISRYGFSSMPFVVILAVYGLFVSTRRPNQRMPLSVIAVSILALFVLHANADVSLLVELTGNFRSALLAKLIYDWLLIAILAVYTLKYLRQHSTGKATFNLSAAVASTAAIAALATSLVFCLDGKDSKEWSSTLTAGSSAVKEINLAGVILPDLDQSELASVLIDGDASAKNACIEINGHKVDRRPELLLRFKPSQYFLFDIMRTFAAKVGSSVDNVRQWRAVTFPIAWLNRHGSNVIKLSAAPRTSATIYGDYEDNWHPRLHLPTDDYFSAAKFCNATESMEGRLYDPVLAPHAPAHSWIERNEHRANDDLSTDSGKQIGQFRMFLALGAGITTSTGESASPAADSFKRKLLASDFDPLIAHTLTTDADVRINKAILKAVSDLGCRIRLPDELLRHAFLRIRISGSIRAGGQPGIGSILPIVQGSGSNPPTFKLFATPPYLTAGRAWTNFEIVDVVPNCEIAGGIRELSLALFPGAWEEVWEYGVDRRCGDVCFKNMAVEVEPVNQPRLDKTKLFLY